MKLKNKNKKIQAFFVIAFVLFLGVGIGFWIGKMKYSQKNVSNMVVSVQPSVAAIVSPNSQLQSDNDFVGDFKVSRVIDGDTIEIEGGEKVRYIGMDTPETVDPDKPVQCFGKEASIENKQLVEGKIVRLEKDTSDRDKYGRLLRYVWVGDDFINLELVQLGFARVETIAPDQKYEDQFIDAQQEAEISKLGLWFACVK